MEHYEGSDDIDRYIAQSLMNWPDEVKVAPQSLWSKPWTPQTRRVLGYLKHTIITQQTTVRAPHVIDRLLDQRLNEQLTHLTLKDTRYQPQTIQRLLVDHAWPMLKSLCLQGNRIHYNLAYAIKQSGALDRLHTLDMNSTTFTSGHLNGLSDVLTRPTLHTLYLHNNHYSMLNLDAQIQWFERNPQLPWRHFTMDASRMNDALFYAILGTSLPDCIETLGLHNWKPSRVQAQAFAQKRWPQLHTLSMVGQLGYTPDIHTMLTPTTTPKLTTLKLHSLQDSPAWIYEMSQRFELEHLELINGERWSTVIGQNLIRGHWAQLKSLNLRLCRMSKPDMITLFREQSFAQLRRLDLSNNNVDNDVLKEMARNTSLTQLKHLELGNNDFDLTGLQHLVDSPYIDQLETLTLTGTIIDKKDLQQLADTSLLSEQLRRELLS